MSAAETAGQEALRQEAALGAFTDEVLAAGALGTYVDESEAVVVVLPEGLSITTATIDNALDRAVRVESRSLTAAAIRNTLNRLETAAQERQLGDSNVFFFEPKSGKVILYSPLEPSDIAALAEDASNVIDHRMGGIENHSRWTKYAPFFGANTALKQGDAPVQGNWCTTAFAVNINGIRYLATAGHCWPAVLQQIISPGSGQRIGETFLSHCNGNGNDLEFIRGEAYSGNMYVGGEAGVVGSVKGAQNPVVGTSYWFSGATTYEVGNNRVTALNGSGTNNCGNLSNLIVSQNTVTGNCPATFGDSGAPFYYKLPGPHIYVRGMHIAQTSDHAYCLAQRWSYIANAHGATIVTAPGP